MMSLDRRAIERQCASKAPPEPTQSLGKRAVCIMKRETPRSSAMNAAQAATLPLIAFGITEFVLRRGDTAKTLKTTAADRGTTALIFGCYAIVVCVLFIPKMPGIVLRPYVAWTEVTIAVAGLRVRWWAMLVLGRFYTRT